MMRELTWSWYYFWSLWKNKTKTKRRVWSLGANTQASYKGMWNNNTSTQPTDCPQFHTMTVCIGNHFPVGVARERSCSSSDARSTVQTNQGRRVGGGWAFIFTVLWPDTRRLMSHTSHESFRFLYVRYKEYKLSRVFKVRVAARGCFLY